MLKIRQGDLDAIKIILGRLYEDNGVTDEVLLLSKAVDNMVFVSQKMTWGEIEKNKNN